ncbi:MAG: hypothetical protein WCH04_15125, partial [Gammaproteobacteria bacterium]
MAFGFGNKATGVPGRERSVRRPPRSPFTSKSVLGAGTALLGSGGLLLATPDQGSAASWFQQYA